MFLLVGLVTLVTAGVITAAYIYFDAVFGKDLTNRFCPSSRSATKAVLPSKVSEEAADYRGSGPHPVHIQGFPGGADATHFALPEKWVVPLDGGQFVLSTAELVVCEYESAVPDQPASECSYRDESGTVYDFQTLPARYAYRVYEAKTGKLLKSFEVKGEMASGDCADYTWFRPGEATTDSAPPDIGELTRQLKPLVEGHAP